MESDKCMELLCSDKVAMSIAHNSVHHDKMKHVEIDHHFVIEKMHGSLMYTLNVKWKTFSGMLTKGLINP